MRPAVSVLLLTLTCCRTVTDYSHFRADLAAAARVELLQGSGDRRSIPVGTPQAPAVLRVGDYQVDLWREACIMYAVRPAKPVKHGAGRWHDYTSRRGCAAPMVGLAVEATPGAFAAGNRPSGPLSWLQTLALGTSNHRMSSGSSGGVTTVGRSWTEDTLPLRQVTDWNNVAAVRATQHGSALLRGLGWAAAVGGYLAGGGLAAIEMQKLKTGEPLQGPRLGVAGAAMLAGCGFLWLALANRDRQVTVFSTDPALHDDYVRIEP